MTRRERRLFAAPLPLEGGEVHLDPVQVHHARVLRIGTGDPVRLFDGRGYEARARITELSDARGVCEAEPPQRVAPPGPQVTLIQNLAKGDKLDDIVRMSTELGVSAVHLAVGERTVARPEGGRAAKRTQRLARIAHEAARQAGRSTVPEIVPPAALQDVAARAPAEAVRLVFAGDAEASLDACALSNELETWICIGPEGGLSPDELARLRAAGWTGVALRSPVLRVETAAPVTLALVLHRLGSV